MQEIFTKIDASFKRAMKGEEHINVVIYWWGVIGYLVAFFIASKAIRAINYRSVDIIISLLMVVYFGWHFYVTRKNAPKKPKLTKEEEERIKLERRKDFGRRFMRKLFLQEPISKWDPVFVTLVIDVFCIATFLDYVLR